MVMSEDRMIPCWCSPVCCTFLANHASLVMPEGKNTKYYFTGTGSGKVKRNILPDNIKRFFEEKPFTCGKLLHVIIKNIMTNGYEIQVEYSNLTEIQERDMFQRVQLGMPLKEGEKLQSIGSDGASWCRALVRANV